MTNALIQHEKDKSSHNYYACPPGQILTGSNTSTCIRNGKWEPDPNVIQCIGVFELVTPVASATTTIAIGVG